MFRLPTPPESARLADCRAAVRPPTRRRRLTFAWTSGWLWFASACGSAGSAGLPVATDFSSPRPVADTATLETPDADEDGDGDGWTTEEGDCDDENANIYPGAEEVWYDGVDQDCAEDNDFDADKDGYTAHDDLGEDCDDTHPLIHPEGADSAFRDGDCDGVFSNVLDQADFTLRGEAAGDWAGVSLAESGDVDGDTIPDFLVGARYNSENGTKAGKVYLVLGNALGATSLLGDLPAFLGDGEEQWLGYSVGHAGDINGDGFNDLLVGALQAQDAAGAVYLVHGGPELRTRTSSVPISSAATTTLTGSQPDDLLSISISGAGDVDNDGMNDILVGAHKADGVSPNAGCAYLVSSRGLLSRTGSQSVSQAAWTFLGDATDDETGRFVTGVDDVDGDGLGEVAIAAPWADPRGPLSGTTYVVLSSSLPILPNTTQVFTLSDADLLFYGEDAGDSAGHSIFTVGDTDGDGTGDLGIGAMYNDRGGIDTGTAYIVLGDTLAHTEGAWGLEQADILLTGEHTGDAAGRLISRAGDMDADGLGDIVVGAFGNDERGEGAGKTYVFRGGDIRSGGVFALASTPFQLLGEHAGDQSGQTAAGIGDINGDGRDDLLVGAFWNDDLATDAGKVYILRSNL